ncbi:MAG: Xaa-Pro peptidase family protein [bacterium]|nr:Xaa-Pro peptidase family protein [bacterium]
MYNNRLTQLRERLCQNRLDGILITNLANVQYLTGFTGSSGTLVITLKEGFFIVDGRYLEQTELEVSEGFDVIKQSGTIGSTISKILKDKGTKRIGFETDLSFEQYKAISKALRFLKLHPTRKLISSLRMIKDKEEIRMIKKACVICEKAWRKITDFLKPGIKERDVAIELEYLIRKLGSGTGPFDIIVASGKRSSLPHGNATGKDLEPGDLVVIDWGVKSNGYTADLTRTIAVGKISSDKKGVYSIVREAQEKALEGLKEGVEAKSVDKRVRDYIKTKGYEKFFVHNTGHGIGREVHEQPIISKRSKTVLKEGMVFTIEPGIYIPRKFGVRIEDVVLLRKDGHEILSDGIPRELIVI